MQSPLRRIAISCGSGYVPGLNSVVTGAVLAAHRLGLEVVGILDGFDGLLIPEKYPGGGIVELTPSVVKNLNGTGSVVGTGARTDPFRARQITEENAIEEVDRSDELLGLLKKESVDAVIGIVGASAITGLHAATVMLKLHRKGLRTVCIPKSAENDVAGTPFAFGYNSILSHTVELLRRIRTAAQDVQRIAVVEVPGQNAGWLALQSGMAVCADAAFIPEIPYDLGAVAVRLRQRIQDGQRSALVVAAEGALTVAPKEPVPAMPQAESALRKSLGPLSDPALPSGSRAIFQSGRVAEHVALTLQRLIDLETFPIVLGPLARGGEPTAVDLQLGSAYGAAAVRALLEDQNGVMLSVQPPEVKFTPLAEAVSSVRTLPADSLFVRIARSLGISLGDAND